MDGSTGTSGEASEARLRERRAQEHGPIRASLERRFFLGGIITVIGAALLATGTYTYMPGNREAWLAIAGATIAAVGLLICASSLGQTPFGVPLATMTSGLFLFVVGYQMDIAMFPARDLLRVLFGFIQALGLFWAALGPVLVYRRLKYGRSPSTAAASAAPAKHVRLTRFEKLSLLTTIFTGFIAALASIIAPLLQEAVK
ncbi:hypothetical protein ACGFKZ_12875 [Micromonospora tulbaghiae]|uniref:hypothetical protein n=1 Tax=Micromonospora tulbaghiae TaxID=479978 RepID=UPI00371532DF